MSAEVIKTLRRLSVALSVFVLAFGSVVDGGSSAPVVPLSMMRTEQGQVGPQLPIPHGAASIYDASDMTTPAPVYTGARWLYGSSANALLVEWQQLSSNNRTFVYNCATQKIDETCAPVIELYQAQQGRRAAVIWGQPGQYLRICEFEWTTPNTYMWRYLGDAQRIPNYTVSLPAVVGVGGGRVIADH